jgi:hypothetical protein
MRDLNSKMQQIMYFSPNMQQIAGKVKVPQTEKNNIPETKNILTT